MPQSTEVKKLFHGYVPNTAGAVYTAPSGKPTIVRNMIIHNTHSSAVQVELWIVVNGGSRTAANKILKRSLAVDETYYIDVSNVLESLEEIHGLAGTASVVNIRLNGAELTSIN